MKHEERLEALQRRVNNANAIATQIRELEKYTNSTQFDSLSFHLREEVFQAGREKMLADKEAALEVLLDPFEEGLEQVHEQTKNIMS